MNFALPDLRGRVPIHVGSGHTLGERGGEQAHTLSIGEIPTHTHTVTVSSTQAPSGTGSTPTNAKILAQSRASFLYGAATGLVAMDPRQIANTGGSQAHLNMQPFLALNFSIALQGIFPSAT